MTDLARRWLAYFVDNDMSSRDARAELDTLIQRDPQSAFDVILELVAAAKDDSTLGLIGAGPLEAILRDRGPDVVDSVVAEARNDARFKQALSHAWEFDIDEHVWERVLKLFGQSEFRM